MKEIDYTRREYIKIIRKMSPENRLKKCFELGEMTRQLFLDGLRTRFPDASEEEIIKIYLKRIDRCRNLNY